MKQRTVLAVLLLGAGRVVTKQEIIDAVWGEESPPSVANTVQTYVRRLRRSFDPDAGPYDGWLITTGTGYLVRPAECDVDLLRFRDLCQQGNELAALALWQGPCVADLGHAFRSSSAVQSVEQERVKAAVTAAQTGPPEDVIEPLRVVAAEEPFNEPLHAQLMLALSAAGRQAEALYWYDDIVGRLAEELGMDPSQQLQEARLQVLRQESALVSQTAAAPGRAWRGRRSVPGTLVGRDDNVRELTELLRKHRVVTLTGPGGAGKTVLALAVAESASDVVFVELGPLPMETDEGDHTGIVADTVRAVMGYSSGYGSAPEALVRELTDRKALLVLDNAEHVVRATADLVDRLTRECPGVRLLVTSRQPLGVAGEAVSEVRPLTLPPEEHAGDITTYPAVELFLRRAAPLDLTNELPAVAELCRRLEGLPLALELAAARVRSMPLNKLMDRQGLISTPHRVGLPHQRSIAASVRWSIDLLERDERTLLERLTVFAGYFGLDAAESVTGFAPLSQERVAELLADLVDRSLIQATRGREYRYRILVPIRESCQAYAPDDMADVRGNHLRWLCRLAREEPAQLKPALPDVMAALEWGILTGSDSEMFPLSVEVLTTARPLWDQVGGLTHTLRGWTVAALRREGALPPRLREGLSHWAGRLAYLEGRMPEARAHLLRALEYVDDSPEGLGRRADILLGVAALSHALLDTNVLSLFDEAIAAALRSAENRRIVTACSGAALVFAWCERFDRAESLLESADHAVASDVTLADIPHGHRAFVDLRAGDFDAADRSASLVLARGEEAAPNATIQAILVRAWVRTLTGRQEDALELLDKARELCERAQLSFLMPEIDEVVAQARWRRGELEPARQALLNCLGDALARGDLGIVFRAVHLAVALAQQAADSRVPLLAAAAAQCRELCLYEPWPFTASECATWPGEGTAAGSDLPDVLTSAADLALRILGEDTSWPGVGL